MTCCSQPGEAPLSTLSTGWVRDGQGIRELLRAAWRSYWEHRVERAGAEFLRLLDADALHDIGISRSELDALLGEGDTRQDGDCPCRQLRRVGAGSGCAHTS